MSPTLEADWTAPVIDVARAGVTRVAVLGGDRVLAEQAASAIGRRESLHLQPWRQGDSSLDAAAIVQQLAAAGVAAVCIGDDVPLPVALGVAAIVDRDHPEMSVVLVASPDAEVWREALRAGVRDIIEPARIDFELDQAIGRAVERSARMREQRPAVLPSAEALPAGRVIVVISPKGGSGKTMVSSNLAAALAQSVEAPVALVDLDVQFGDSASALGLVPERTIGQLAAMPAIDPTTLKVLLTHHDASGAYVLCGPDSPEEDESVTAEHAGRIVDLLVDDFAFVVVDTPAGLDERTLTALERATDIVCVTSTDVSSIRSLGKEIVLLERLGLLAARRHFVLNRADARVGIESTDVETALGMPINAAVPSSRAVPLSMNQGRPIVIDTPSSPVARELLKLADRIVGRDDEGGRRGRLPWRRK
jgi:pilus assembly protein CpaE